MISPTKESAVNFVQPKLLDVKDGAVEILNENPIFVKKNSIIGDICKVKLYDTATKKDTETFLKS